MNSFKDHKTIGNELDLFHFQEEAAGHIFWHKNGYTLFKLVENYIREKLEENGYEEVKTPVLINNSLWEKSGHFSKFKEMMFCVGEDQDLSLKPMNCPCHVQIFNYGSKSYRDLPIRMSEFGMCHRNESSGSLYGAMRTKSFTQDDAHIFCREDQIESESENFVKLLLEVYNHFGFKDVKIKFSTRPAKRIGDESLWDRAEAILESLLKRMNLDYEINPGEGAFYGPKLEFSLKDSLGRDWQCGTLQLDFMLPVNLDAYYTNNQGVREHPIMLHRAILGSVERFVSILLEHYQGNLPVWLAPVQAVVCPISEKFNDYALQVYNELNGQIRVSLDDSNEKISYKIKANSLKKIPYIIILGAAEETGDYISYNTLGSKETNRSFISRFVDKVLDRE